MTISAVKIGNTAKEKLAKNSFTNRPAIDYSGVVYYDYVQWLLIPWSKGKEYIK